MTSSHLKSLDAKSICICREVAVPRSVVERNGMINKVDDDRLWLKEGEKAEGGF